MTRLPRSYGFGTSKSLQIFSARESLISQWRGMVEIFARRAVDVHAVTAAFPQELDAVAFEVTDQVDPLHDMEARGSRITVLFRSVSSVSVWVDSKTN